MRRVVPRHVLPRGDVRSGSVKRVASAVGEGAMPIMFVHLLVDAVTADGQHPRAVLESEHDEDLVRCFLRERPPGRDMAALVAVTS